MNGGNVDRQLASWFAEAGTEVLPPGLLEDVYAVTRQSRQRYGAIGGLRDALRWRAGWDLAPGLRAAILVGLVVLVLAGVLLAAGALRRAEPELPATNGLLAVQDEADPGGRSITLVGPGVAPVRFTPPGATDSCGVFSRDGRMLAFATRSGELASGDPIWSLAFAPVVAPSERTVLGDRYLYVDGPSLSWAPGGREIVAVSGVVTPGGELADRQLRVYPTDGSLSRSVAGPELVPIHPVWAPDGRWIAFSGRRDNVPWLHVVRPDGTDLRPLAEIRAMYRPEGIAWSPDSTQIAFVSNPLDRPAVTGDTDPVDVFVIGVDGSGLRNLTDTPDASERGPAWSPDGTRIAFYASRGAGAVGPTAIVDAGSGVRTGLPGDGRDAAFAWSVSGEHMAVLRLPLPDDGTGGELWRVPVEGPGPGELIAAGVSSACAGPGGTLQWQVRS